MLKCKKLKELNIIFLVTTSLLLITINFSTATEVSIPSTDIVESSPAIQALVNHAPFEITHDDNFTDYGFAGTGTRNDPYLITGYNITTTSTMGIYVIDTTKHFTISDCYIQTTGYGIVLETIEDGTAIIDNTTLNENGWEGIYLDNSWSVTIVNSTFTDNGYYGVELYYSHGSILINNTFENNGGYGIEFWHSTNSTLIDNTFYNDGVYMEEATLTNYLNFTFENNWVNDRILGYYTDTNNLVLTTPDYGQLILVNCDYATIHNQDLSNTAIGLYMYWCDHADIRNNTCNNNMDGMYLEQCTYSSIINNSVNNNYDDGIASVYDTGSVYLDNVINDNVYGLWLFITSLCEAFNNTCNDNEWLGIYLWVTDEALITNNTCIGCKHYGIYLQDSDANLIAYNHIQESSLHGLYLDANSDDSVIHGNRFVDNNLGGTSQGFDDGSMNSWFYSPDSTGNWWSDYNGIPPYPIDGAASNTDPFPEGPIIVSEYSSGIQILLLTLFSVTMVTLSIITKNRNKKN